MKSIKKPRAFVHEAFLILFVEFSSFELRILTFTQLKFFQVLGFELPATHNSKLNVAAYSLKSSLVPEWVSTNPNCRALFRS